MNTSAPTASRRVALVMTVALTALLASLIGRPGSAFADAPIEHGTYSFEFDFFVDDFCGGVAVRIQGEFRGMTKLQPKKESPFAYFMDSGHGFHNYTNLATGKTVSTVTNAVIRDQELTDNGDGTLTVRFATSGREVVYGPGDRRPFNYAGTTWYVLTIDHAGTPFDPSDDVVLDEQVRRVGAGSTTDACQQFRELTA